MDNPAPIRAPLGGTRSLWTRREVLTLPLHTSVSTRSLVQPVPPLSSGTLRAALSLLASPTPLSHRAELSQGRGTDGTFPLGQQMHPMVLS